MTDTEDTKVFFNQLGENVKKQPGWGWLLVFIYTALWLVGVPAVLDAMGIPTNINIAGRPVPVPKSAEVWATILTFIFYQFGDALDKRTFKKWSDAEKKRVDRFPIDELDEAEEEFGVRDGLYDISMKILEKAGPWPGRLEEKRGFERLGFKIQRVNGKLRLTPEGQANQNTVHFWNEMAKVFRSLLILALVVAIVLAFLKIPFPWALVPKAIEPASALVMPAIAIVTVFSFPIAIALVIFLVLAYQVYPRLKNIHRIMLYRIVMELLRNPEKRGKTTYQRFGRVLMFFWEGVFVGSAACTKAVGQNIIDLEQTVMPAPGQN